MQYVVVMPFVWEPFKERCLRRCRFDNLLLVDNTKVNLGVMRSHNYGVDAMYDIDADWLIVMSAAVRFGDNGGLDFIHELGTTHHDHAVVSAKGLFGWHLIAFSRECIDAVGYWDCNYSPYGLDDNDMAIRIHKALPHAKWGGIPVDVTDTIMAHSIKLARVKAPYAPRLAYFTEKWGRGVGGEFSDYFDTPFDNPALDVTYWPEIDGVSWESARMPETEQVYWR